MTNGGGVKAGNRDEKDATSGGVVTLHTPILKTPAAGPSARVRPRVTDGGGSKEGNQSEKEEASIFETCAIEDGVATNNDVRKEMATDMASGGAATLHTLILETPAVGPSAGVRPRVMHGGGGKAGDQSDDEEVRAGTGI